MNQCSSGHFVGAVSNFFENSRIFANECLSAGPGILHAMLAFIYVGIQIRLVSSKGEGASVFTNITDDVKPFLHVFSCQFRHGLNSYFRDLGQPDVKLNFLKFKY
jgi:hypothetical protein